jgi:hypothetical protein
MDDQEKARAAREQFDRDMQSEVNEILGMIDNHRAKGEGYRDALDRLLKALPYTDPPFEGPSDHDWSEVSGEVVRCQHCGVYDAPVRGVLPSDATRPCIPVDLSKTKTLTLLVECDGKRGRETMEILPMWDALEDMKALCGIDAEKEVAEAMESEVLRRRMLRMAIVRMFMDERR